MVKCDKDDNETFEKKLSNKKRIRTEDIVGKIKQRTGRLLIQKRIRRLYKT